jgi:hypothetical protein
MPASTSAGLFPARTARVATTSPFGPTMSVQPGHLGACGVGCALGVALEPVCGLGEGFGPARPEPPLPVRRARCPRVSSSAIRCASASACRFCPARVSLDLLSHPRDGKLRGRCQSRQMKLRGPARGPRPARTPPRRALRRRGRLVAFRVALGFGPGLSGVGFGRVRQAGCFIRGGPARSASRRAVSRSSSAAAADVLTWWRGDLGLQTHLPRDRLLIPRRLGRDRRARLRSGAPARGSAHSVASAFAIALSRMRSRGGAAWPLPGTPSRTGGMQAGRAGATLTLADSGEPG